MKNTVQIKAYERHCGSSDISLLLNKSKTPPVSTSANATPPELTSADETPHELVCADSIPPSNDELLDQIHEHVDHELQDFTFKQCNPDVLRRLVGFLRDDKLFDFAESSISTKRFASLKTKFNHAFQVVVTTNPQLTNQRSSVHI